MDARDATPTTLSIPVTTPSRAYEVTVGTDILREVGARTRQCAPGGAAAAVVADSNVAPLYAETVARSLRDAGFAVTIVTFPAGERHKRMGTLARLLDELAACELTRADAVVAVGGGVTGDMGGLAAALYLRGVTVVQVPTSLLAMVDSSVGGKTAVDIDAGKNLVGAFWQPGAVVADVSCLSTLSHDQFSDSCGEVIKHAVLADATLLDELTARPLNDASRSADELVRVVARNVEIKRDVVSADERERGARQTLNLGHTIGHAIEAASDYTLGHGSSVAAGLCCIARAAATLGWGDAACARRIVACVRAHGLPTTTSVSHETLIRYSLHDKKRRVDGINLAIPVDVGDVRIRHVTLDEYERVIAAGCVPDAGM